MTGHARITVGRVKIDRIPEYFLDRYDQEIAAWAMNAAKINPKVDDKGRLTESVKTFILREGEFSKPSPQEDQGAELLAVRLIARFSAKGVHIAPASEMDENLIANHCQKMQLLGVPARARLIEPARPGLPFLPNIRRA